MLAVLMCLLIIFCPRAEKSREVVLSSEESGSAGVSAVGSPVSGVLIM